MAIRVGVVGGGMGRSHALAYHQARPKCDLVWVADLDRSLAEKVAGETGSKPITDWTAGLGEVDAVSLCTPHHLHAPMTIAALEAGKHVLVEKPMANSEAECQAMIAAARRHDRRLMVGYVVRFNKATRLLKQLVDEGRYGAVFNVEAWTEAYLEPKPGTWFSKKSQLGGGVLFSHGCHYVDIITWLLGEPVEVRYFGGHVGTDWMEGEGTAQCLLRFAGGAVGHYACSWGTRHTVLGNRLHLYCRDALLVLDYGRQTLEAVRRGERETLYQPPTERTPGDNPVYGEIDHFLDCIASGAEPETGGEEALKSLRVVWSMYAAEGGAV